MSRQSKGVVWSRVILGRQSKGVVWSRVILDTCSVVNARQSGRRSVLTWHIY